jgi:hypothetical protein
VFQRQIHAAWKHAGALLELTPCMAHACAAWSSTACMLRCIITQVLCAAVLQAQLSTAFPPHQMGRTCHSSWLEGPQVRQSCSHSQVVPEAAQHVPVTGQYLTRQTCLLTASVTSRCMQAAKACCTRLDSTSACPDAYKTTIGCQGMAVLTSAVAAL